MTFIRHLLKSKDDNKKASILFFIFFMFYVIINSPYIYFMEVHYINNTPFKGIPFTLNLFNFDPTVYYGINNALPTHPLFSFLTTQISFFAKYLGGNFFLLVTQSFINALNVLMIYFYLRGDKANNNIAISFAVFFGVSSYCIFTALIPDSYTYSQFVIILSLLYFQYCRMYNKLNIFPNSIFALFNFGITSTNIVTFMGSLLLNKSEGSNKLFIRKYLQIVLLFLSFVVFLTLIQYWVFEGKCWVINWSQNLQLGGYNYTAPFSFPNHWKVFYLLLVNPILTPTTRLLDPNLAAIVTNIESPFPLYVKIIALSILILAVLGFIRRIRSRQVWILISYIVFAVVLHIIIGFGLSTFEYDMYLYAGHYLFAFFLLTAIFIMSIKTKWCKNLCLGITFLFIAITLANNIYKHIELVHLLETLYSLKK